MAHYLGIEVTESRLQGALLRTAYKKLVIEGVYTVYRAPGPEGLAQAARDLAGLAQQALALGHPGGRPAELDGVYAALPGHEVSLRAVSLPRAVHKRGDQGLVSELDGQVPFDVDEALVDAVVIAEGDPVQLLATAVLTERVEAFVGALVQGGLDPREVGVAPVALAELAPEIPALQVKGPVAVLHAYERRAELVVLSNGVVRFARTLVGLHTPAARDRALRQSMAAWVTTGGGPLEMLYLAGDEAMMMAQPAADVCGLTSERLASLPQGMFEMGPSASPTALWEAPVAVALATRGLGRGRRMDLRKGPLAVSSGAQVLRERASWIVAAAASIVVFWGMATYARYRGLVAERTNLQATLASVTREAFNEAVTDPEEAIARARGGRDEVVDPMPGADAYDVLGALSTRITAGIRHDIEQLDVQREHVQIQGIVNTLQDRDRVVEALSQYPCFPTVNRGRVTANPGDNRQKYTLDIEFRCPGAQRAAGRSQQTNGGARGGST